MNRIRSYRAIEGVNQAEVGRVLGISPQMVSSIEKGSRALSVPLTPLGYRDERADVPAMTEPLHRQKAVTKVSATGRAKELLRLAGEVFAELRAERLSGPVAELQPMAQPMSDLEIDDLASDLRCGLFGHEEHGPIRNLTQAVERAGVCLVPIVGLQGIDGISSWVDGQAVIGLSVDVPGDRFRFTLAHEVAHLTMHRRKGDETEAQANRFASSLLVPPEDFVAALPRNPMLRDFVSLKGVWGVSVAALVFKAHELGRVDDDRYRALQIQMSKWRRTEPGEFAPAVGKAFAALVDQRGGIASVATQLGVNPGHLAEVVDWRFLRGLHARENVRSIR